MSDDEATKKASQAARKAAQEKLKAELASQSTQQNGSAAPKKPAKESRISVDEKGQPTLKQVKVYSPFRVYFDGPAHSISAANKTGPFDILPGHKNFMTLLDPCEVSVRTDKGEQRFTIARGIMHVRRNLVTVFLDV